jgi:hypothetical protein
VHAPLAVSLPGRHPPHYSRCGWCGCLAGKGTSQHPSSRHSSPAQQHQIHSSPARCRKLGPQCMPQYCSTKQVPTQAMEGCAACLPSQDKATQHCGHMRCGAIQRKHLHSSQHGRPRRSTR